jgi:histidine phosphotransferase ChpT
MTTGQSSSHLEFAALMCSRLCHDVIGPVGAIINGLEVLDDDDDEEMRKVAFDLIRKSARQASAKLQLCRLAFGAAGSAGADLDLGDAEQVVREFVAGHKVTLEWSAPHETRPKNQVKLLLNLVLIALGGIPRGGTLNVALTGDSMSVWAEGEGARVSQELSSMLAGEMPEDGLDARSIQLQYSLDLAQSLGLSIAAVPHDGALEVNAAPRAVAAA